MAAMEHALTSDLQVFLFTDVDGSTRRWDATPRATAAAIRRYDELLREIIEAHDGTIFKTVGDAVRATFPATEPALAAAVAAQRALTAEPWDGDPIRVRMALHAGRPDEERDRDSFGRPVNPAAALVALGHGSQ